MLPAAKITQEIAAARGIPMGQNCASPASIATQNKWLMRGLDPNLKSARLANCLVSFRQELLRLCHACGFNHPSLITLDQFEILGEALHSTPATEILDYQSEWSLPSAEDQEATRAWISGPLEVVSYPTSHVQLV